MTDTLTRLREVVCSNCTRPLGEYSTEITSKVGKCCANLPPVWGENDRGTYHPEPDEDDYPQHCCQSCGSNRFEVRSTEWLLTEFRWSVTVCEEDLAEGELHIDSDSRESWGTVDAEDHDLTQVECAECGEDYHGSRCLA